MKMYDFYVFFMIVKNSAQLTVGILFLPLDIILQKIQIPREIMQKGAPHKALKPLLWLLGNWRSIKAEGFFPTIKPFTYCDHLEFTSIGQPLLNYKTTSWHPTTGAPIHFERGFLRINPGTNRVAFLIAHNLGVATIEEGCVEDEEIHLKSVHVGNISFVKEPEVVSTVRNMRLNEDGRLEVVFCMQTTRTALTQHLLTIYEKIE